MIKTPEEARDYLAANGHEMTDGDDYDVLGERLQGLFNMNIWIEADFTVLDDREYADVLVAHVDVLADGVHQLADPGFSKETGRIHLIDPKVVKMSPRYRIPRQKFPEFMSGIIAGLKAP